MADTPPTPAAAPDPRLGRSVAIGAAFMVLGRLGMRMISLVSTLLLVRLLVPEDFGLIALAGAAFALADTLSATGYTLVLVRRRTVDRAIYDTAWTMNGIRCLGLAALVAATAPWQADLLGEPRIEGVLYVIALTVALDSLASIGLIRLQRELRFDLVFRHQLLGKLVAFLATILLAWIMQSYYCLVLGNLIARIVIIPYGYWLAPHRPRFSLSHWRELLSFSKWMIAQNLCIVADGQAANLVIGRVIGVQAVGVFNVAYQIAAAPVNEFAAPIRYPIYAGYARVSHDIAQLRLQYVAGFGFLLAVLLPLSIGIALVAPELERLALGPAWQGTAVVIALAALYALADAIGHFTANIFIVLDRLRQHTLLYAALVVVRLPAIILAAIHVGLIGVVSVLLATAVLNALVWQWQAARLITLGSRQLWREIWRSLLAALAMTATVLALRGALPGGDGFGEAALRLVLLAGAGAAVHLGVQAGLWWLSGLPQGPEARALTFVAPLLRRFGLARRAAFSP